MSRPGRIVLPASLLDASYGVRWLHACTSGIPDPTLFEERARAGLADDILDRGYPGPNHIECHADPTVSQDGGILAETECQTERPDGAFKGRYVYEHDGSPRFSDLFQDLSGAR